MTTTCIATLALIMLLISCTTPNAKIRCPVDLDLGKAKPNDSIQFAFPIVNTGEKVLEIQKISADCNCLLPENKKEKTLIKPGDSLVVKGLFFTGQARNNLKSNSILIQTNINPTFHEIKLRVHVN